MDTQDWIVLSLLFYAAMAFGVVWYSFKVRRASVFEPIGQYLVFVSLFTLPLPIRASITMEPVGNVSPYLAQFAPYLAVSVVLTAISLPTFAAGYYSRAARRLGDRVPLLANRNTRGMRAAVFALVALSTVLIYFLTLDIGGLGAFLLLGYKSSEATFGRGYLAVGFPWLVVAMVALLELYRMTRSWFDLGCFFALLLVNLGMHVVTGNRSMLMYLGIVLAIYVHFAIRRLSWALLLPIAIAGFIGLNLMGMLRGSNYDSLDEFTEQTTTSVDHLSGDGQEGLFYTLTIGEFVVPFETLPQMVRSVGVTQWPWLGLSILRAPVYLIPRIGGG